MAAASAGANHMRTPPPRGAAARTLTQNDSNGHNHINTNGHAHAHGQAHNGQGFARGNSHHHSARAAQHNCSPGSDAADCEGAATPPRGRNTVTEPSTASGAVAGNRRGRGRPATPYRPRDRDHSRKHVAVSGTGPVARAGAVVDVSLPAAATAVRGFNLTGTDEADAEAEAAAAAVLAETGADAGTFVVRVRGVAPGAVAAPGAAARVASSVARAVAAALNDAALTDAVLTDAVLSKGPTRGDQSQAAASDVTDPLSLLFDAAAASNDDAVNANASVTSSVSPVDSAASDAVAAMLAAAKSQLATVSAVNSAVAVASNAAPELAATAPPPPPPAPAGLLDDLAPSRGERDSGCGSAPPPPPEDLFGDFLSGNTAAPPPAPPGLFDDEDGNDGDCGKAAAKPVLVAAAARTGPRVKRLHWQRLDAEHAALNARSRSRSQSPVTATARARGAGRSIWSGSEAAALPFDEAEFARTFSAMPIKSSHNKSSSSGNNNSDGAASQGPAVFAAFDAALAAARAPSARVTATALAADRARQLEIVLRAARLPLPALAAAVAAADAAALPYAALECLARHAPSQDEIEAIATLARRTEADCARMRERLLRLLPSDDDAAAAGEAAGLAARREAVAATRSHVLGFAEEVFALVGAAPLLKTRLQLATALHAEAAETALRGMQARVAAAVRACEALVTSQHLRTILHVILRFGNFMNADQPAAVAFHISTLTKLGTTNLLYSAQIELI